MCVKLFVSIAKHDIGVAPQYPIIWQAVHHHYQDITVRNGLEMLLETSTSLKEIQFAEATVPQDVCFVSFLRNFKLISHSRPLDVARKLLLKSKSSKASV